MKRIFTLFVFVVLTGCSDRYLQGILITSCEPKSPAADNFSKSAGVSEALQALVDNGVPGTAMAVFSEEGWWSTSVGLASIEQKTPMQTCHLQYLQSISKTYMAVAILKLYEQGKISLDAPMTKYLPAKYSKYVVDGDKVTVRMLLNHTSGIPEYNFQPAYVSLLFQEPDHFFTPEDYLKFIDGKPLTFTPGSKYSYRNTNYLILALIGDELTGDHAKFISDSIFTPLGLTSTFYRHEPEYLKYPTIVNTYWDRYSDGRIENASQMQRTNVSTLIGDDGIVTTPVEAVKFLKGLVEGKLLSESTLAEMKTWVKDAKGNERYGLGLAHTVINGIEGFGHSGGGIGAGCELYYFPSKKTYMFIGINLGTVTDSPLHIPVGKAREKMYAALL
ncbi:MAG TPA: serine hydrolase domain-containing protein [Cyclobacteriaceae bacterium]|nr:serine hydrolase domain-containing protein [Cyclobacteriaceae bacterium]